MRTLYINKNDSGQRLDKFLTKSVKALPVSLVYKYIRTKKIKVNRKRTAIDYRLNEGDTVELFIKEEFFDEVSVNEAYRVLQPKIDIVHEDDDLIICNKRPGMIAHPDDNEEINTLIGHIKAYLYQKGEYDPDSENSFAPALCNRIDRNTGGLMIAAKNAEMLRHMNELIKENKVVKKYLCVVHGILDVKEATLTDYLVKDGDTNTVTVSDKRVKDSKTIITKYKVIRESGDLSLLDVELVTGRTHQIRAHMAYIGHPLLGDGKYGVNRTDKKAGYKYQALYSYYLNFEGREYKVEESDIWFMKDF
jgi:pseudouridine synthase, RluA family